MVYIPNSKVPKTVVMKEVCTRKVGYKADLTYIRGMYTPTLRKTKIAVKCKSIILNTLRKSSSEFCRGENA